MKNKVGHEEPKITLKRKSCRSRTETKDREEKSSIYQKLNKAFHVLRAKRPVHPDQEELEEQRRKVLKVFKEFIKEDKVLKHFKLDQIGQNMDEDTEYNKKKGAEKKSQDMKAISSQETPAVSDEQAIYVETIASEPSVMQSKAPSRIQQTSEPPSKAQSQMQTSEPPSKAQSQMQAAETQKTPSRLTQPSEVMEKTSQKKKYDAIHLSDSTVLEELRVADQRAKNAAKMLESVKEHISKNAEKEEMTEEDIQLMQRKQAELMEKMSEFEEITKRVQQLVGLRDVSSSNLGLPSKPVVNRKSDKCVEELPKVIVCGPGMDQIPKIIVCEPTGKDKKPGTVYQETMEPVKNQQKRGVQYNEDPHYLGQTPEDSMRQLVSTVQQTSQFYPPQYSPPSSPNFGYPEPFVYQQNPAQYNYYGQVDHPVPKVNAEENEDDFSPLDTEKQLNQLKDQENSLLELLKNIIQQKDLHLILVTEQYKSPIWETAQNKLNQLYREHQRMLNDQVHLNIQQQQFYQSEYNKNLNSRAKGQVKRQIRRLQQHQKINSLMQQNVLKQMSIQEMLKKTNCSLRQIMEIYDSIQILQEQHQKLYEALFQQIVNQKEMLQSQLDTERLVENHEKEIKMLKEEEKVAHQKNIEEHSSSKSLSSKLRTMEDRSDGTIEEVSSLTELEEQISELKTITEKWDKKPKGQSDDSYSIKWNRSNFKFQLKRRRSESWAPENLVPLDFDAKSPSESSDFSLSMSKHKHKKYEKKIEDEDFDHERLQYLVKENIERQKVHEVLRQVLCTVSERLDIGLKHQRLQQEKTKALIFKNIEQQQHLQDNLLHKVVTPQQKFVIQSRILHLYTLLQQLLQQQQCEEKQIERFEKNQTLLDQLIKKNEKHVGQLLHSLKCHQLSILDYINFKGSELKKKILSKSLSLTQEKQSRAKLFKLHQIHSKIVVQLHSQQARLQPPQELREKNLEQISVKKIKQEKFKKETGMKKEKKQFEGLSMLNGLEFEKKDMHLDEIQKKIAFIQQEKKKLNQNEKEETDNETSQYLLLKDKIKTEEVDHAISKLGRLQSTIGFLKEHATSRK